MIPLLLASLIATAAGTALNANANRNAAKSYNRQAGNRNRDLERQFADRQQQMQRSRAEQTRLFNDTAARQDQEFLAQRQKADERKNNFIADVKSPVMQARSQVMDAAVDKRLNVNNVNQNQVAGFGNIADTTENRVLRESEAGMRDKSRQKVAKMLQAQASLGALGDVSNQRGMLFNDMIQRTNDQARDQASRAYLLDARLRPSQFKSQALSQAMGETASTPYFEPNINMRQPNTLFGDLLTGAGSIGAMSAFNMPKTPKKV